MLDSEVVSSPAQSILDAIETILPSLQPDRSRRSGVTLDSEFDADLGLDSLSRAELVARLETELGHRFKDSVVMSAATPRDLLRALQSEPSTTSLELAVELNPSIKRSADESSSKEAGSGSAAPNAPSTGIARTENGHPTRAPVRSQSLVEAVLWHVANHPQRLHVTLIHEEQPQARTELSYGELVGAASRIANGLKQRGIGAGDVVVLMLPTGADYLHCFLGVLLVGAIVLPIYPPIRPNQIEEHLRRHHLILDNAQARLVVVDGRLRAAGRLLAMQSAQKVDLVTVDQLRQAAPIDEVRMPDPDEIAFLQYTSGSTGEPKGVVLTHRNVLTSLRAMRDAIELREDDVMVSWLPLYHDMGLIGMWLGPLVYGVPLVLMSPLSFLARPERWLQTIHDFRGTISGGPNFAFELCTTRIPESKRANLDLGCWRFVFNGAEPVSAHTMRRFARSFASNGLRDESLAPVYGLAEATLGVTFTPVGSGMKSQYLDTAMLAQRAQAVEIPTERSDGVEVVSCGQCIPGFDMRVVDSLGHELSDAKVGELEFRGRACTTGYFRSGGRSADLFHGGWLRSGDLGYISEGELYITGRIKDLIIRGGRNVYPYEIEQTTGSVEGIRTGCVAAFGVTKEANGTEQLVVVAETRVQSPTERELLKSTVVNRVQQQSGIVPDVVELVAPQTVLKTSSGKIRRAAMRDSYLRGDLHKAIRPPWQQIAFAVAAGFRQRLRLWARRSIDLLCAGRIWLSFITLGLIGLPVMLLMPSLSGRWRVARRCSVSMLALSGIRVRVTGGERLDMNDPMVLVCNHQSYLDAIVMASILPGPVAFVAKRELAAVPFLGWFLRRMGVVFVDRFDATRGLEDARQMQQRLAAGHSVFVFPEGTFSHGAGLLPFQLGAFVIALSAGTPLQLLVIRGSRHVLKGETFFPRPGTVDIDVLERVRLDVSTDFADAVKLRNQSRDRILERCAEPDFGHRRFLSEVAEQIHSDRA